MEVSANLGRTNGEWRQVNGTMILYLRRDTPSNPLEFGDELLIKGTPQPVPTPKNPGEFDYRQFLEFKGIHHQHFVTTDDVLVVGSSTPGVLRSLANDARLAAAGILKKYISGEREQAMALALILGVNDEMYP
jgi:competence protein ComEC